MKYLCLFLEINGSIFSALPAGVTCLEHSYLKVRESGEDRDQKVRRNGIRCLKVGGKQAARKKNPF